jgi:hypothetical protein
VIDVGAIEQEHIAKGSLLLVMAMGLDGGFLRLRLQWPVSANYRCAGLTVS